MLFLLLLLTSFRERFETAAPEPPGEQISNIVRRIFEDKTGTLWIGTNDDGVFRYNGKALDNFSLREGLSGFQVTGIIQDRRGNIWISTNGGLSMFDGRSFANFGERNGLFGKPWSLFEDCKGTIWAGTVNGLYRFDGKVFTPIPLRRIDVSNPVAHSAILVRCITEDRKGNLWIGTAGDGVFRYDGSSFSRITTRSGLCDDHIVCALEDRLGNMWFGSMNGGLSRYDGRSFRNFTEINGIGDNEVWNVYEDRAGNIWFTSEGFGIYRYDGKELSNFAKKDGLNVLAVQSICEDKKGRLWVGGAGGLYRFNGRAFVHVTKSGPWE